MGYIWSNYKKDTYYYMAELSPYVEVWDDTTSRIGVNIDIRLDEIFIPSAFVNDSERVNRLFSLLKENARYGDIFNIVCHIIARTDLLYGTTIDDLLGEVIKRDIKLGAYGNHIREKFESLKREDAEQICRYLAKYEHLQFRETQLDAAIKCIFGEVNIYYERSSKKIYVCINKQGTEYNRGLFDLVCYFLKDIELCVEPRWLGEYFGIIGVNETMKIDSIALL